MQADQWRKILELSAEDMSCILNLENLGVQVRRKTGAKAGGRLLNFGKAKNSTANVRKACCMLSSERC